MKPGKLISIVVGISVIALAGCSGDVSVDGNEVDQDRVLAEAAALVPKDILDRGVLEFGTDVSSTNRPFEYYNEAGEPEGFDIDLSGELAARLGLRPSIQNATFDSLIGALQAARINAIVASMAVNATRQEVVDFVDYVALNRGFLTRADDKVAGADLPGVCGLRVVMLAGAGSLELVRNFVATCDAETSLTTFDTYSDAAMAVRSDRADVLIDNFIPLNEIVSEIDELVVTPVIGSEHLVSLHAGVAVQKGSSLGPAVQLVLEAIHADGTYEKLLAKWGIESAGLTEFRLNSAG